MERTEDNQDLDDRTFDAFGLTLTQKTGLRRNFKELTANSKPESASNSIEGTALESPPKAGPSSQYQSVSTVSGPSRLETVSAPWKQLQSATKLRCKVNILLSDGFHNKSGGKVLEVSKEKLAHRYRELWYKHPVNLFWECATQSLQDSIRRGNLKTGPGRRERSALEYFFI